MNAQERQLLTQLRNSGQSRGKNHLLQRTACEFVIEHGWWYTPLTLPDHIARGNENECFKNAFDLTFEDDGLIYVEGYAVFDKGPRTHHAWVTDRQGNAFDNSWPRPGVAYAGVPFLLRFTNDSHVKNRAVVCLIGDYLNDWPLLRELGDRPHEWMDPRGTGRKKIMIPE